MNKFLAVLVLAISAQAFAGDAVLKSCEFNLAFNGLMPTPAEKKVPWAGLDLLTCTVVVTDQVAKDGVAAGVYPAADAIAPWQVRVRQAYLGTNQAEVSAMGTEKFEGVESVSDKAAFAADKDYDADSQYGPAGVDAYNPNLMRWGAYDPEHHVFVPMNQTFIVKTKEGNYAKLQVFSYTYNGGGYEADPKQADGYQWNPKLNAQDGKVRVVVKTVANLTVGDKRLK